MATVSGLSLESYVQIYKALIKTSDKVQAVTPIEECYYKVQDLRQVCCQMPIPGIARRCRHCQPHKADSYIQGLKVLTNHALQQHHPHCSVLQLLSVHGLSASKFNRTELLQAIKGKPLVNPFSQWLEGTDVDIQHLPPATAATCSTAVDPELVTGADLSALGWVEAGARILTQPIEQLQIDMLAGFAVIPGENDSNMLAGLAGAGLSAPMAGPSQQQQWQHETAAGLLRFTQQPVQEGHRATSDAGCPWSAEIPQQLQTAVAAEGMHVCEGWRTAKRAKTTVSSPLLQQHPPRTTPTAPLQAAVTDGPRAGQQQGPTTAAAVAANERALMIQNAAAGSSEQACSRLQPSRLQQRQRLHLELTHMLQQQHDGLQLEQQLGSGLNFSCGSFQQGVPAPQQQQEHQQHLAEQEDNANETEAEDDDEAQLMGDLTAVAAANPLVELLQQAGLPAAMPGASQQHAHQLLKQLQLFAAAGAVASQEVLPTAPAAAPATLGSAFSCDSNALLGRHVGFVLTEEMLVAGTKNMQLTFPAGVYEVNT